MIGPCGSFAVNSARPERRFCKCSGAQLNLLCVQFAGGFDLKWIGIDEKARHDARLTQPTYRGADYCDIRAHIQTSFSSYLAGILGDQRYRVRLNIDGDLHHVFSRGHFDIQISRHRPAQHIEIGILNMPPVAA